MASASQIGLQQESSQIIEVKHLTKRFTKGLAAIDDISFNVGREVVGLFGPSGCGKTTTLRCIAGLETPDSGEISIDGKFVTSPEKHIFVAAEKRNIGLVFQNYALWPHMKVFDNVAYALKIRHVKKSEIENRVSHALERVGLSEYARRYPAQLSGGQQQRVALARSLIYEPKVILLDEPLSNLDAKVREKTRIELKSLLSNIGISTIYVTHDQEEAFLLSDRIGIMKAGKLLQFDTPHNLYQEPKNEFVASFVGRSNLLEATVASRGADPKIGKVRLFDKYEIASEIPENLPVGSSCIAIIRANELGLSSRESPFAVSIPCSVKAREYRGGVTDHIVEVGNKQLTVSTHRFCDLSSSEFHSETAYLVVRDGSVAVIPKSSETTDQD